MSVRGALLPAAGALALALVLATSWTARAELAITPVLISTFRVEGFGPEHTLRQAFIAARDGLSRADLGVASAPDGGELLVRIVRSDGREVTVQLVPVVGSLGRQTLSIRFPVQAASRGQAYVLEVRRPEGGPEVVLEGLDTDGLRDGQFLDPLRDLAETRALDLNVRLFQERTLSEGLADAWLADPKVGVAAVALVVCLILGGGALLAWAAAWPPAWGTGTVALAVSGAAALVLRGLYGFA
jgi:hypothetical protein